MQSSPLIPHSLMKSRKPDRPGAACPEAFIYPLHTAAVGGSKGNNRLPFQVIAFQEGIDDSGSHMRNGDPSLLTNTVLHAQHRFQKQMDTCSKFQYEHCEYPRYKF